MYLLEYVFKLNKHNIYMFADQDDVWHKDKIELTVSEYYKQENTDIPLLIHTDLNVVDSNLKRINKSFIAYSNLNPYKNSFNDYLIQNNVTGCTMLINNKLVEKVSFKAKNIVMHDWYFAILASLFGKVVFLDKSTIDYRQHDKNVLGAQKVSSINYIKNKIKNSDIKADLIKDINQGKAVLSIYEKEIDDDKKNVLLNFCKLADKNKLCKLYIIIKYRFYKNGLSKLIGEILFI